MKYTAYVFLRLLIIIISTPSSAPLGINSIALAPTTTDEYHNISSTTTATSKHFFILYRPLTNYSINIQNQLDYQHHNISNSSSIVVWVNETSLTSITRSTLVMVTTARREGENTIIFSFLPEKNSRIASSLQYQQRGITHDAFFYDQYSCQMVKLIFLNLDLKYSWLLTS